MIINRYRSNSLKSAIEKAKADLGADAKVIHVRQLDNDAISNNGENIEIIAAIDEDDELLSSDYQNVHDTPKLDALKNSLVSLRDDFFYDGNVMR